MGSGGTVQLVAYGAQDLYLTSKPQITYWKTVHKRHTLFAVEPIKQEINGTVGFGKKFSIPIAKNGDLLNKIYFEITLPDLALIEANEFSSTFRDVYELSYVNDIGISLFKTIDLDIGGQKLERHTSEYIDCWLNLTTPESKRRALNRMIGHRETVKPFKGGAKNKLFLPLQFFFNRHAGLALPLVAMLYHDVKIHVETRSFFECITIMEKGSSNILPNDVMKDSILRGASDSTRNLGLEVYANMVFLDTMERRYFASNPHEYLIEQVQYLGYEDLDNIKDPSSKRVPIPFVNPVKELIWVFTKRDDQTYGPHEFVDIIKDAKIVMNGNERFSVRTSEFFRILQPWEHHTAVPEKPIYIYSFAILPEDFQPSGTCNFSKLESAYLQISLDWEVLEGTSMAAENNNIAIQKTRMHVFAISYNMLRIIDGLAALTYHA
jgi:Major capsid protein N-terminus/Large eukaryotic DNA virus major capsid protein